MARSRKPGSAREHRLSIRTDAARKAVIARAARQHGETLSDFVLENAYQVATELLADESPVSLSRKQLVHIFVYASLKQELLPPKLARGAGKFDLPAMLGPIPPASDHWWNSNIYEPVNLALPLLSPAAAAQKRIGISGA